MENVNEQLIFDAYECMRQQEEQAVRETKRACRARQRRAEHQKAEQPQTAQEYTTGDEGYQQPAAITLFDEMEELD